MSLSSTSSTGASEWQGSEISDADISLDVCNSDTDKEISMCEDDTSSSNSRLQYIIDSVTYCSEGSSLGLAIFMCLHQQSWV